MNHSRECFTHDSLLACVRKSLTEGLNSMKASLPASNSGFSALDSLTTKRKLFQCNICTGPRPP